MTFEPLDISFRSTPQRELTPLERSLGLQPHSLPNQQQPENAPLRPPSPAGYFLSNIPNKPLTWLWPGRIPLGHLTLLDAAPGSGLSLFALTLAACISSGSPLPDGTPTLPGNVILFAPYDDASDTIKPRLQAAGADLDHILLFRPFIEETSHATTRTRLFALPRDQEHLAATIRRLDARLLILDPASSLPGLSHSLPFLIGLAHATDCAILLTCSLHQPPADPFRSPGPSSPLREAARSRLLLTPDPADERHYLLLTTRHPLCAEPPILAYDILASQAGTPAIHWLAERDRTQLARICTGPLRSPQRQTILRFLHNTDSPRNTREILEAACYDYDAGRKLLFRMKMAEELVSPARGLYTTPNHPCLTQPTADTPPVPDVPSVSTVPSVPTIPDTPSSQSGVTPLDQTTTAVPPLVTSCDQTMGIVPSLKTTHTNANSPLCHVPPGPAVPITDHLTGIIPTDQPVPTVPNPAHSTGEPNNRTERLHDELNQAHADVYKAMNTPHNTTGA